MNENDKYWVENLKEDLEYKIMNAHECVESTELKRKIAEFKSKVDSLFLKLVSEEGK